MRVRIVLLCLVIAVLTPLLVVVAGYGYWNVRLHERAVERALGDTALALSLAVDREINTVEAVIRAMARSPLLSDGDFERFYEQARDVSARYGGWIVLTEPSGRQVFNTIRPFEAPPGMTSAPDAVRSVIETGRPYISDLLYGRVSQRWILFVMVPVIIDGRILYSLDMAFTSEPLSRLLASQTLPPGSFVQLVDRNGVIIARSIEEEQFLGKRAREWILGGVREQDHGVASGRMLNGVDATVGFHRSRLSGWAIVVGAPTEVVRAPIHGAAQAFAIAGFLALSFAALAAIVLGRMITLPLQRLGADADAVVSGGSASQVSPDRPQILEIAEVRRTLTKAGEAFRERIAMRLRLDEEQRAREAAEDAHREIRKRELALDASERRYRALTQAIASVIWTAAPDGGAAVMSGWRALTGLSAAQCEGYGWLAGVHADDRDAFRAAWTEAIAHAAPFEMDVRVIERDGRIRWYGVRAAPVADDEGWVREWVGVCIDIDERKSVERRQALLLAELDHRVRNILATVQAMVALTGRGARGTAEFAASLQGRIEAMARTHGLLTKHKWRGASLAQIVRDELSPYATADNVVSIDGPDCILPPKDALNIALALHELATNAAKYGALSSHRGRITVEWRVEEEADGQWLNLLWRETGGPPVETPKRRGFGSQLIEQSLGRDGRSRVSLDFEPTGVACRISLQMTKDTEGHPAALSAGLEAAAAPSEDATARPATPGRPLALVVEDEPLVALDLSNALAHLGFDVLGPAQTLGEALALADDERLDLAVLDVNLRGEMSDRVADLLSLRGVPVIFVTGYRIEEVLPERLHHHPAIQKPIDADAFAAHVRRLFRESDASFGSR